MARVTKDMYTCKRSRDLFSYWACGLLRGFVYLLVGLGPKSQINFLISHGDGAQFLSDKNKKAMEVEVPMSDNGNDSPLKNSKTEALSASPSSFFDDSGSLVGEILSEKRIAGELENCDEDGRLNRPEKKRRLKSEQVKLLEKIFEVENKLGPCRKLQIANEIGLNPRQVAIWFQNRRARSKSKHLEREFDLLKSKYDELKSEYDVVLKENQKLRDEVSLLSPGNDYITPPEAKSSSKAAVKSESGVMDSDLENEDSSNALLNDNNNRQGELSGDDESMSFLQPLLCFSKVEDECCYDDLQPNSCNLGFPVQDQGTWLWRY